MKKFYTKFTNGGQSWRTSVSNAIFKRQTTDKDSTASSSDTEDEEESSNGSHGSIENINEAKSAVEGLMYRTVPDGESFTKDGNSDSSDIYCIPDTSINHTSDEQPYQNIVDMTEELEKLKRQKFTGNTQTPFSEDNFYTANSYLGSSARVV